MPRHHTSRSRKPPALDPHERVDAIWSKWFLGEHERARTKDVLIAGLAVVGIGVNLWFLIDRDHGPAWLHWTLGALSLALLGGLCIRAWRRRVPGVSTLDRWIGGGHLAQSWGEARTALEGPGGSPAMASWLAESVTERLREEVELGLPPGNRSLAVESQTLLALLALSLLFWLLPMGSPRGDGVLRVPVAGGLSGADSEGGDGSGQGAGGTGSGFALQGASKNGEPGELEAGEPDPQAERQPETDTPSPEERKLNPDAGAPSPEPSAASDGTLPELGSPEDPLELPKADTFVLPEFIGEGPTTRTTMPVAALDEQPLPTDPTPVPPPPEADRGQGGGDQEPDPTPLDPIEFSRAEEWPLRARHVPPEERPSVRRWFELLQEIFR